MRLRRTDFAFTGARTLVRRKRKKIPAAYVRKKRCLLGPPRKPLFHYLRLRRTNLLRLRRTQDLRLGRTNYFWELRLAPTDFWVYAPKIFAFSALKIWCAVNQAIGAP